MQGQNDFDFLFHDWRVRHRKLQTRLADADDWIEFDGTSSTSPLLGGAGNVEDNRLDDPSGAYRAAALRSYDSSKNLWRIWWLDLRFPGTIGPAVVGRFDDGVGIFHTDDTWEGRPIKLRFLWRQHVERAQDPGPSWEQAFSVDGGQSWETNWTMDFIRR